MKNSFTIYSVFFCLLLGSSGLYGQGVAINNDGSDPHPSAMLEIKSIDGGVLIPRLTQVERDAISSPALGLMVYQTDDIPGFYYYDGSSWELIGSGVLGIDNLSDGKSDGQSIFIGSGAGVSDDASDNKNVGIGAGVLNLNASGYFNAATGHQALSQNTGSRHSAFGYQALYLNSTGESNTAMGFWASNRNSSGSNNLAIGYKANFYNQEGSNNTMIGYESGAGSALHNKSGNVFLGYQAGYDESSDNKLYIDNSSTSTPLIYGDFDNDLVRINGNLEVLGTVLGDMGIDDLSDGKSTGNNVYLGSGSGANEDDTDKGNTALGYHALYDNTSGYSNTAIGELALENNNGNFNTAIGQHSMMFNQDGSSNTAVGRSSLRSNTTGDGNTALGIGALANNTTKSANTAVGYNALYYNSLGLDNSAFGYSALADNTEGFRNSGFGRNSLSNNTTGDYNVATGYASLYSNTSGHSNVALGARALQMNEDRSNLVAVGDSALYNNGVGATIFYHGTMNTAMGSKSMCSNTTGYRNTSTGFESLYSNTVGYSNTAIGRNALYLNTEGDANTATGSNALYYNTTGDHNTAIGRNAMNKNEIGWNNTGVGVGALYNNTSGAKNVSLGNNALHSNTTNDNSTAIGNYALFNSTGEGNLAIGADAGYNITTGSDNIIIGSVDAPSATASNQLYIGSIIYGDLGTGRIGLGTTAPAARLHVYKPAGSVVSILESADSDADMLIKSKGNVNATVAFYDDGAFGGSVGYNNENDYMFLYEGGSLVFKDNKLGIGTFSPSFPIDIHTSTELRTGYFLNSTISDQTTFGMYAGANGTGTGDKYAGAFDAIGGTGENIGVRAVAINGTSNIAVYGTASGGTTNWAGYFNDGHVYIKDALALGISSPSYYFHMVRSTSSDIAEFYNSSTTATSDVLRAKVNSATPGSGHSFFKCIDGNNGTDGQIRANGTGGVGYYTTSDGRLKMNIKDISGALEMIDKIQPRQYEMKNAPSIAQYGFIAQELNSIYPMAVVGDEGSDVELEPMMIDYSKLTPLLAGATKELNQIVKEQQNEIDQLKQELESIKKLLEKE